MTTLEAYIYKLSFFILFVLVSFSGKDAYYLNGDERANLSNVEILQEHGIGKEYLNRYFGLAGPVYPILQYLIKPLTGDKASRKRLLNICFLLILIYLLSFFMESADLGWLIMTIPMTYLCAGYAMTILPALVFLSVALLLLLQDFSGIQEVILLFVGGLFLSLAILTRINLLVLLPLFIMIPIWRDGVSSRGIGKVVVVLLGTLPLLTPVFATWGGVIPPVAAETLENEAAIIGNYSGRHLLLNLSITTLIFLLVIPGWFVNVSRNLIKWGLGAFVALFLLNLKVNIFNYIPAQILFLNLGLEEHVLYLLGNLFGSIFLGLCLFFCYNFYIRSRDASSTIHKISHVAILLVIVSAGFSSLVYSSRYAWQVLPFIFLLDTNFFKTSQLLRTLRFSGLLLGYAIYFSFRFFVPEVQVVF